MDSTPALVGLHLAYITQLSILRPTVNVVYASLDFVTVSLITAFAKLFFPPNYHEFFFLSSILLELL